MMEAIIEDFAVVHPGHIEKRQKWIFNIAGGAVGMMTILHGSLSEYLILFGTAVGTEGFSGRYRIDIYDFMLAGEMWTYTEEDFRERTVSKPGDMTLLRRGQAKGLRLFEGTWMLEYGRGPVPTTLPFALGGAMTSMDATIIFQTLWLYGRLVVKELRQGKI